MNHMRIGMDYLQLSSHPSDPYTHQRLYGRGSQKKRRSIVAVPRNDAP